MNLTEIYNKIKQIVIEAGYQRDIDWLQNIPSLEQMSKLHFFSEYCWVVINSGFRYQVAKKVYDNFWNNGKFNFDAIRHEGKHKAVKYVYNTLDSCFKHFKNSKNKLKYLESLPWIGPITKNHLARNLGFLEYAKADRHLVRIASYFNFNNVQKFCETISKKIGNKPGVVDLVFWRFAESHPNYLELLEEMKNEESTRWCACGDEILIEGDKCEVCKFMEEEQIRKER
jgi:hypothetical protein